MCKHCKPGPRLIFGLFPVEPTFSPVTLVKGHQLWILNAKHDWISSHRVDIHFTSAR